MFISFLYILLALLGLGFLVLIHELGHYFMARRLGMKVDVFSVGMGSPIWSSVREGVKWQIGWLPFGGYVKIAGTETDNEAVDVYEIKDGFFGRGPWARIKVAFMGPLVNLVFAFVAFGILWSLGGREKNFSEYTHKIGWIDPKSELYVKGIRPGDEIISYNGQPFKSSKDHVIAPMTADGTVVVEGFQIDPLTKTKKNFSYAVKTYPHPEAFDRGLLTTGVLSSANYLIYDRFPNGQDNPLSPGSALSKSGITYGDRIVWVNGESVYSLPQLVSLLNDSKVLLTVERKGNYFVKRVPRVFTAELRLDSAMKEELTDWQFESQLNQVKFQKLLVIPYNLNNQCTVESLVKFVDPDKNLDLVSLDTMSSVESPLEVGDKIIAVDGIPVSHSFELLARLQQRHVNVIVERSEKAVEVGQGAPNWTTADELFDHEYNLKDLEILSSKIGRSQGSTQLGDLVLLSPVTPKMRKDVLLSAENKLLLEEQLEAQKEKIEMIQDPEERARALRMLASRENQWVIELPMSQDKKVNYNPGPFTLFANVFDEVWQTLKALVTGSLNPKWMSGPIGIVQVMHDNSMVSLKEALFWLGAISLNLGMINLVPFPVLDGGTICFAFYEVLTGKRIPVKTMEKVIIPFAILLIAFFVFLTYNDILRIFS